MSAKAKRYMNKAVAKLEKNYNFSNAEAVKIIENSFLYESLLLYPDDTIHNDLDTTIEMIYNDLQIA